MAQEWYYTQGDQKVGPVSVKELKQAAADGTLQPTDLVWTDGMKEWKEARTVKGLEGIWPSSPPSVPARRTAKPVAERPPLDADDQEGDEGRPAPTRGRASPKPSGLPEVTQQWWLIGLSLFCCFPVGLVFVWMHPRLTKSTKWTISGVVGVLFIGMMILGQIRQKAVNDSIADADRVWTSGDKKGAVEKYRKLLDSGDDTFLTDEQKPLVYGRVIDYDAESGNAGSAVKLAEKALERGIEPSVNQPAGQAAVAEAKKKRPNAPASSGDKQSNNGSSVIKVRSGAFGRTLDIELSPFAAEHVNISDFKLKGGELTGVATLLKSPGPGFYSLYWTGYDDKGVKVAGSTVNDGDLQQGQKTRVQVLFGIYDSDGHIRKIKLEYRRVVD